MEIGERIKYVRENILDKKLSMDAFGKRIGVSSASINQWEKGNTQPPKSILQLIAREFNVNETWLLTGEGEMHEPPSRQQEIAQLVAKLATLNMEDPADQLLYDIEMWLGKLPKSVWDEFMVFIKEEIPKLNLK